MYNWIASHYLPSTNNAAVNILAQISLCIHVRVLLW